MSTPTSTPSPTDFEKLGVFYLGKRYDLAARARTDDLILYDSKDLTTHAVCVGMTGSGKTGLCLGILEEAAIDGIPAIVVDPKGDLANLLLTFPDLAGADFRPWINEEDARKKGLTADEFAAAEAGKWAKGLAEWGQDGARIRRLKDAAECVVYTPGSSAGVPVSVLKSFAAPPKEFVEDGLRGEAFRERVATTATSLLALMKIDADPITSREHVLLSAILAHAWTPKPHAERGGTRDLDLTALIQLIQTPPFDKLGVMPLETVYPGKDRFALAMALNNVVASPGFASWMEGVALDIGELLYTKKGRPRIAIFSIAHLGDADRMFFVSLLMNQILAWVRTQSGTTSLRALVYMDEIAGYFPPTANPPSKQPMLTLMKQARAFGVGMVLATQNPVDLDYKGLANAGTWFIGRLQTERDKVRVLDGLEGAASSAGSRFDRASMDRLLSQLGARVFLMNNVHEDAPEIIESRWCLSYLRGPMTRSQVKMLMDGWKAGERGTGNGEQNQAKAEESGRLGLGPGSGLGQKTEARAAGAVAANTQSGPVLPNDIPQYFIPARAASAGATLRYSPKLLGLAKVYYSDSKLGVDQDTPQALMVPISSGPVAVDWDEAEQVELGEGDLVSEPDAGAAFGALPAAAGVAKNYAAWQKDFSDALFKVGKLELFKHAALKATSKQGEGEKEFRLRLAQLVREQRDEAKERLRAKFAPKLAALDERERKTAQRLEVEKMQSRDSKVASALSFGSAILGAFLGRKMVSAGTVSKASTAMRSVGRATKESGDVGRAEENIEAVRQQRAELEAQFAAEVAAAESACDPMTDELERVVMKPKKSGIKVRALVLAWAPEGVDSSGGATAAW